MNDAAGIRPRPPWPPGARACAGSGAPSRRPTLPLSRATTRSPAFAHFGRPHTSLPPTRTSAALTVTAARAASTSASASASAHISPRRNPRSSTKRHRSASRFRDNSTGEWKDGDSLFLTCNVWRQAAENVAESLQRGMRVIVSGRLRRRSYETKEGEKRTVVEVEVDDVGPSLRNASAKVNKVARSGSGDGGYGGGQRGSGGGRSSGRDADPWGSSGRGGYSDEPPFLWARW